MKGFYKSYHFIEPFIKQSAPPEGSRENLQSIDDRKKLVIPFLLLIFRMVFMNVFSVPVAQHPVLATGGIRRFILDLLHSLMPIDGW